MTFFIVSIHYGCQKVLLLFHGRKLLCTYPTVIGKRLGYSFKGPI